jgi:hypothetical protein
VDFAVILLEQYRRTCFPSAPNTTTELSVFATVDSVKSHGPAGCASLKLRQWRYWRDIGACCDDTFGVGGFPRQDG